MQHCIARRVRRRQRRVMLLDLGAGVSIDLQPDRDLDDDRSFPLHGRPSNLFSTPSTLDARVALCQPIARTFEMRFRAAKRFASVRRDLQLRAAVTGRKTDTSSWCVILNLI